VSGRRAAGGGRQGVKKRVDVSERCVEGDEVRQSGGWWVMGDGRVH
jgi:hypothetical protein